MSYDSPANVVRCPRSLIVHVARLRPVIYDYVNWLVHPVCFRSPLGENLDLKPKQPACTSGVWVVSSGTKIRKRQRTCITVRILKIARDQYTYRCCIDRPPDGRSRSIVYTVTLHIAAKDEMTPIR